MKKIVGFLLLFVATHLFAEVLKVGATPIPHAQILKIIVPDLKKEGIDLKIVEFTDYVTPNLALENKSLDANFMQTVPYLNKMNQDRHLNLVPVANIHVEPLGLYSKKIKSIKEFKNNASIGIPNDPSNGGRALILLHQNALITLKDPKNLYSTEFDIVKNPKNIKIRPLDAALLTKSLPDLDGAVINTNYALQANLSPKNALINEGENSPYANVLVVRKEDENKASTLKLKNALQSQKVKDFILKEYNGEVLPAF